jgi:hypothetical protein
LTAPSAYEHSIRKTGWFDRPPIESVILKLRQAQSEAADFSERDRRAFERAARVA